MWGGTCNPSVFAAPFNAAWRGRFVKYLGDVHDEAIVVADRRALDLAMRDMCAHLKRVLGSENSNSENSNSENANSENSNSENSEFRQRVVAIAMAVGIGSYQLINETAGRFCALWREREKRAARHHFSERPAETSAENAGFEATDQHLRFGRIVGDALGVHHVFGAMLSPTGGIVGPENGCCLSALLQKIDCVRRHTLAHDACGYLFTYHGEGPGYRYLFAGDPKDPSRASACRGHIHLVTWI